MQKSYSKKAPGIILLLAVVFAVLTPTVFHWPDRGT